MSDTERKVAIVTGSATGVGAAAAIMLAERGCNVIVNYTRSEAEAEDTARTCREKGAEAITVQADVSVDEDCQAMAQAAIDAWGRIDYLINNAARTKFNPYPNLDGIDKQDFLDIYAVNVVGAYQMIRAVEPHMRKLGKHDGGGCADARCRPGHNRHFSFRIRHFFLPACWLCATLNMMKVHQL